MIVRLFYITVQQLHVVSPRRQRVRQVDAEGGLSGPAFAACYRDDHVLYPVLRVYHRPERRRISSGMYVGSEHIVCQRDIVVISPPAQG